MTTAVTDEEVIEFFMKSIAPVVNKYQKVILLHQRSSTGSAVQSNSRNFEEERDSFIANLSKIGRCSSGCHKGRSMLILSLLIVLICRGCPMSSSDVCEEKKLQFWPKLLRKKSRPEKNQTYNKIMGSQITVQIVCLVHSFDFSKSEVLVIIIVR